MGGHEVIEELLLRSLVETGRYEKGDKSEDDLVISQTWGFGAIQSPPRLEFVHFAEKRDELSGI